MSSNTAREAAIQHLAANKLKAAAAVLERHITESNNNDKDAPDYVIDTFELDTALRKGMEKLEHLREIRATTEECRIKAAAPSTAVNREFREQSTWWLPQQDLPKSWFPAPPNITVKTATGPRAPRPVSPKHPPPSTPVNAPRGRPSSAALRAHGVTDVDVALALGEAAAGLAQQQAAMMVAAASASGSGAEQSPRRQSRGLVSPHRNPRGSFSGAFCGSGPSSRNATPGDGGAAAPAPAGGRDVRVAWSLPSRRGGFTSGPDIPPGTPVLYDGGGDAAVPGAGPAGPMVPPPGYSRYTLNLFQMKQQQLLQLQTSQQHGAGAGAQPNGSESAPLFIQPIQSDGEDAEEEEEQGGGADDDDNVGSYGDGNYGAADGIALGTGFRALADEEPQSKHQHVALSTSIQAAAARVVAANAEAKGAGPGRLFGMVGTTAGVASAAAPEPPPPPTQGMPSGRGVWQRQAMQQYGCEASGEGSVPELLAPRQSSPLVSELRTAAAGLPVRTSSPGMFGGAVGATDSAGVEAAAAGTGPLAPTPPEPKPAASLRLGRPQPSHRNVLQSDSGSGLRGSAPASPQTARAALSGLSGRLRLGLNAGGNGGGGGVDSPAAADGGATSPGGAGPAAAATAAAAAVGSIGAAPSLRARLRLLAVPSAEDDLGSGGGRVSSPGGGGFSRCLLAPASPGVSASGTPAQLDSPSHSAQLGHPRFSERSLLAPYGSGNSLDTPGSAGSWAGAPPAAAAADWDAASPGDGVPTPPPSGLGRTVSRRRILQPSSSGDQAAAALDAAAVAAAAAPPPLLQPQRFSETAPEGKCPTSLLPSTSARGACGGSGGVVLARRPSGSGAVGVGAGGRGGSPLVSGSARPGAVSSPMSPPHLGPDPDAPLPPSWSSPSHASAPLPALPSPSYRSQQQPHHHHHHHHHRELHRQHSHQLQRSSSRSCDSGLAPQLEGYIHLGTGPIAEEDSDAEPGPSFDRDDSDPHLLAVAPPPSLPPAAALSLPSPRPTSTAALLPSPRPSSGHGHPSGVAASSSPGASGPVPHRRGAAAGASMPSVAPPNSSSGPFLELPAPHPGAKDPGVALRRPSSGGGSSSSRARRSSMPNGHEMPPGLQRHHGGHRSHTRPSHSGVVHASDIRPWETPPISPLKARSSSVSGGTPPGGGAATGLAATVLPELQPAPGAATTAVRSASVSGVYAQLVGSSGGGRLSTAGTGATSGALEEAPNSPITAPVNAPEYRLNVGPMPTHRKGEMPVIAVRHTLDI